MRSPYTHAAGHEEPMLVIGNAATATGKTEARLEKAFAENEANKPRPATPENYQYPIHEPLYAPAETLDEPSLRSVKLKTTASHPRVL